jgi:hypothetical protein
VGALEEKCGVEVRSSDAMMELQRACQAEDVPSRAASPALVTPRGNHAQKCVNLPSSGTTVFHFLLLIRTLQSFDAVSYLVPLLMIGTGGLASLHNRTKLRCQKLEIW